MELDANSLDGHWAKDNNLGVEFFIINDAVFSKLCILGDDVEPCFEGSSVTAISSEVEKAFSNNKSFSSTLFTMMNELTDALQSKGGLEKMPNEFAEQETVEEVESTETEFAADEVVEEEAVEETVDYTNAEEAPETEAKVEFTESDDDKDDSEEAEAEFTAEVKESEVEEEQPANVHTLEEYAALESEIESLRAEIEELREFKLTVENEQKDALMESFPYNTLSAEDKREVMEHKSEYSLDEIKAKLAVIYIEKGVQFAAEAEKSAEEVEDEDAVTTFSLDGEVAGPLSELQEALRKTKVN